MTICSSLWQTGLDATGCSAGVKIWGLAKNLANGLHVIVHQHNRPKEVNEPHPEFTGPQQVPELAINWPQSAICRNILATIGGCLRGKAHQQINQGN